MRQVVIPTAGQRDCLRECLTAIGPQVQVIWLVHNCPREDVNRWVPHDLGVPIGYLQRPADQPFNLSAAWNAGLDAAYRQATPDHVGTFGYTAVLNDDAIAEQGWFSAVVDGMNRYGAVAGSTHAADDLVYRKAGPVDPTRTMQGWAFVLRNGHLMHADESMAYWYADNDLAWRAADTGGTCLVRGPAAHNLYPNGSVTPELHAQIARDRERFIQKWGVHPW